MKKKRKLKCSILGTGKARTVKMDGEEIRIVERITSVDKVFLWPEDKPEEAKEEDK